MVDYKTKPPCFGNKEPNKGYECLKCARWIDGCFLTWMQEPVMRPRVVVGVDLANGKDKTEVQEDGSLKILDRKFE